MERIRSTASRFKDKIANDYLTVMRSTEEGAKLVNNDDISSRLEAWIDNLFVVRNDEEGINQHIENHFAAGEKYVRINMRSHLLNLSARFFKMELCHLVIDEDTQGKEARNIYTQISMIVDTWTSTTMEAYMNDRLLIERHAQALSLIKRADTALLAAKQNGKNNFALAI